MDIDSVRRLRAWSLEMLDVVPGLRRLVNDLVRVEVIDRAMVIAAQGLLALVPLLIVLAAFLPHDLGIFLVERFSSATGVGPNETESVRGTLTTDQVRTQMGAAGLVLTLLSATSFGRSIQRMYERVWQRRHVGGIAGARRCLFWLTAWLVLIQLVGLLGKVLGHGETGSVMRLIVQMVSGTLLWWWTSHVLLVGRETWRRLLPGAVITGIVTVLYSSASSLVMPRYAATSASQLGSLGLVLAATTWLIGFAFILVVAAVLGRVLIEEERIQDAVSLFLLGGWRRRSGDQLDHQQGEKGTTKDDQREAPG